MQPYRPVIVDGTGLDDIEPPARVAVPPLMRGYLRLGAQVCGEPAHDPDFGVGDFPALLDKRQADIRYLRDCGRWGRRPPWPTGCAVTTDHPWLPRASCDASCITAGAAAAGQPVVVAWRIAMRATFALLLLSATPLLAIPMPGRSHIQRGYCRLMLRCLGVRITVSGGPIRNLQGVLVVSGHVSWVDIFAIGSVMPGSFVARADLIDWPALGIVARLMKVIPIDRANLRRLPDVVGTVAGRLRAGQTVVAFPEGTTWCGLAYGAFRPAMFQAAVDAGRPVQPLRLTYHHRDGSAVDRRRLRRRRHAVGVDPPARHRPAHGHPRAGPVAAAAGNLPAGPGGALRSRGPRRRIAAGSRSRPGGLTSESGRPIHGRYPGTVMTSHKPVYLDHAATTPMHPAAIEAMTAVLATVGNASSLHGTGRVARRRMEEARESLAHLLGARPSEVIFTAGGTESDNLAVKGIYWARRDSSPQRRRIVTTPIEHHAVLDAVQWLAEHEGAEVTWLPVGDDGSVAPAALREALQAHDDVALVSIMWANNEVGTIMPIAELAAIAAEFDVPMHSDAIQAVGQIPVDFTASGLSAMSVAAHKFGGPTGVGALLLRRDTSCVPLLHGGGQERDVRSGTPDVAGAVAMAAAARVAIEGLAANSARVQTLRDRLIDGVLSTIDDVYLNGATGDARLPGNTHFTFRGCEGDSLLMLLDAKGIECSTGSACTAGVAQPSHVLLAMGADPASARGSLRLSLGHTSTEADVDAALAVLPAAVERARQAALASAGAAKQ